jgi:hypothetical protein
MNERAKRVLEVVEQVIRMPDVQPGVADANGNTNTTWCNRALHRMLVMLGGHADLILEPKGINWTTANRMVIQARGNIRDQIQPENAQTLANEGRLIAAMAHNPRGPGHVELVVFDAEPFIASRGPKVGGAGAVNGIRYVRPRFANLDVEFYEIPVINGCAD